MKSLKQYLEESNKKTMKHLENVQKFGLRESVYNESSLPKGVVRIWVSFDIDNDTDMKRHNKIADWTNDFCAETWGNSVRTFIADGLKPNRESVAKYVVDSLLKYDSILDGQSFEDNAWRKTKDISLYVSYCYKTIVNGKSIIISDYFVLVQNADIPYANNFEGKFDFNK